MPDAIQPVERWADGEVHMDWARFHMRHLAPTNESFSALLDRLNIRGDRQFISPVEMKHLLATAVSEMKDENFGHGLKPTPLGTVEMSFRVAFSGETIGDALRLIKRFHRIIDVGRKCEVNSEGGKLLIKIIADGLSEDDAGSIELVFITMLVFALSAFCGRYLKADRLFTRSKLYAQKMPYNRDLGCAIAYASHTAVEYHPDILDYPKTATQFLSATTTAFRWAILVEKLNFPNSIDPGRLLTAAEVISTTEKLAALRNVDDRQKRRIFKSLNNNSERELKNGVKVTRAMILLSLTNRSIETIAEELDFADDRSFRRFLRKEIGKSPTEYREQAKEASAESIADLYTVLIDLADKLTPVDQN
jgi:AraC-like DNA-binding protein